MSLSFSSDAGVSAQLGGKREMSILGFLKKDKKKGRKDLPPLPDMSSLPPLPEVPGEDVPQVPMPPIPGQEETDTAAKELEMPSPSEGYDDSGFPDIPSGTPEMEPSPAELPDDDTDGMMLPDMEIHPAEDVPDKIPDLAELPEPPEFRPEELREIAPLAVPEREREEPPIEVRTPPRIPQLEGFPTAQFIPPDEGSLVRHRKADGPLFVKMEDYKEVLEDIEHIKIKFKECENAYTRTEDQRSEQDKRFEQFRETLEDIQRKLLYMDRTLFEAE